MGLPNIDQMKILPRLGKTKDGLLKIQIVDVHDFQLNNSFPYFNILRKWNKLCIAFDFVKNQGQVAFNGRVSALVKNPDSDPNMKG